MIDADRIIVGNNEATGSAVNSIILIQSHDVRIANNTLRAAATGILFFRGNSGDAPQQAIEIVGNDIRGMQYDGVRADSSFFGDVPSLVDSHIAQNTVVGNGRDGVHLGLGTSGNTVESNVLHANDGYDCYDESSGSGTAGTANTWQNNDALTENRPGLCLPADDDDGVPNSIDNCPGVANPDQLDTDHDGQVTHAIRMTTTTGFRTSPTIA